MRIKSGTRRSEYLMFNFRSVYSDKSVTDLTVIFIRRKKITFDH